MIEPHLIKQLREAADSLETSYKNRLVEEVTKEFNLEQFHTHFYWSLSIEGHHVSYALLGTAARNCDGTKLGRFIRKGSKGVQDTAYWDRREALNVALNKIYNGLCHGALAAPSDLAPIRFDLSPQTALNVLSKEGARWEPEFDLERVLEPVRKRFQTERREISKQEAIVDRLATTFFSETRMRTDDESGEPSHELQKQPDDDWTIYFGTGGVLGCHNVYLRYEEGKEQWAVRDGDGKMHLITGKSIKFTCDCFVVKSNDKLYRIWREAANLLVAEHGFQLLGGHCC